MSFNSQPLRYDLEVPSSGRIEVQLPLPAPSHVTVYVVEQPAEDFADLLASSTSSTDFWNNRYDDEDWDKFTSMG